MQLTSELRRALDGDEFQVHYRPIVGAAGAIEDVKALIRWNHPNRGLVMPGGFIPAAESSRLILEIGDSMLRHACGEFETLTRGVPGAATLGVSVNLSTRQLSDPRLLVTVQDSLTNARLHAGRLTLEITESTIMDDVADATRVLKQLRSLGVKIAMDDFGTGYSSLSLLSEIPIDRLKIDRSFVTGMADRPESSRMIRAILGLAGELGLDTVVEGVEELEQHQRLRELGCQACQGFYFAKPQPAAQLVELLQRAAHIHTV